MSESSTNILTFFKFLSFQGINNGQDLVDKVDINNNDIIEKSEFQKYLTDNWNNFDGIQINSNDIKNFFGVLDKNISEEKIKGTNIREANALSEKEINKVGKQIEATKILSEFLDNKMKNFPSELSSLNISSGEFKNSVSASLMETCQKFLDKHSSIKEENLKAALTEVLEPAYITAAMKTISNKVAQATIDQYRNLQEIKDLDNNAFEDLQKFVDTYVNTQAKSFTDMGQISTLIKEVQYIVSHYFAMGGVGTVQNPEVNNDGHLNNCLLNSDNGFSDLQSLIVEKRLKDALASLSDKWPGVDEYLDNYKEMYKEHILSEDADFNTLNNIDENAVSNYLIDSVSIKTRMELHYNLKNINVDFIFCQALCGGKALDNDNNYNWFKGAYPKSSDYGYSAEQANAIWQQLPYTDIADKLQSKVSDGSIKSKGELYDALVEEIKNGMTDVLASSGSVEDMYKAFTDSSKQIAASSDEADKKLSKLQEAAISFCAGIEKTEGGTQSIEAVIGTSDYTTKFKEMSSANDIKNTVKKIYDEHNKHFIDEKAAKETLAEYTEVQTIPYENSASIFVILPLIETKIDKMAESLKKAGIPETKVKAAVEKTKVVYSTNVATLMQLDQKGTITSSNGIGITINGNTISIDESEVAKVLLNYLANAN